MFATGTERTSVRLECSVRAQIRPRRLRERLEHAVEDVNEFERALQGLESLVQARRDDKAGAELSASKFEGAPC